MTLSRSYNPMDPDVRERQRTLDVDLAIHLSRARQGSVSVSPEASPLALREHDDREPEIRQHHEGNAFPNLFLHEEREMELARGEPHRQLHIDDPYNGALTPDLRQDMDMTHHLAERHEPHLLGSLNAPQQFDGTLPLYQPPGLLSRQTFNFQDMEDFAVAEKMRLGLESRPDDRFRHLRMRKPSQPSAIGEGASSGGSGVTDFHLPTPHNQRERKLSQSIGLPRRHGGGKMALFEGIPGAPPASLAAGLAPPLSEVPSFADISSATVHGVGHDRPYRFSFYSNGLGATIHARSLCELPADGQTFEDMFAGVGGPDKSPEPDRRSGRTARTNSQVTTQSVRTSREDAKVPQGGDVYKSLVPRDPEGHTWWLDVLSPTDEEMKMLSKVRRVYLCALV
jgi:magnesium transporter